jgi:hypothetical protein
LGFDQNADSLSLGPVKRLRGNKEPVAKAGFVHGLIRIS